MPFGETGGRWMTRKEREESACVRERKEESGNSKKNRRVRERV